MDERYKNLNVLVVDDHMMMRTMVRQHLESMGFAGVETANDGKDALEKIEQHSAMGRPFNIVFLDWHMPNVEGFEVLTTCRKNPKYNKTAFVMLTAEQEEKNVLRAIQAGSTSYLIKPVARDALEKNLVKVVAWLEKQGFEFQAEAQKKIAPSGNTENSTIPQKLQKQLGPVIAKGIKNIFSELFQAEILEDEKLNDGHSKQMVCIGRLQQKDITIDLRFFFEKELLKPLLSNLYAPEFLENDAVFEDAATEIVNILCGQIKAFMNSNGYTLEMTLPRMGLIPEDGSGSDAMLNVCFSLNKSDFFLIDVDSKASAT